MIDTGLAIAVDASGVTRGAAQFEAGMQRIHHSAYQARDETGRFQENMKRTASVVGESGSVFESLTNKIFNLKTAFMGLGASLGVHELIGTMRLFQTIETTIRAVTASAQDANAEYAWMREMVGRLGMDLGATAESWALMLASAKNTKMEGAPLKTFFQGLSEELTALHKPAYAASAAMIQFQQMIAKGKVNWQDLRAVENWLPDMFSQLAQATGKGAGEMLKLMEEGKAMADVILPKLGEAMHKNYGKAAEDAAWMTQGLMNKLHTAWLELQKFVIDSGFERGFGLGMRQLLKSIDSTEIRQAARDFGDLLGNAFKLAGEGARFLGEHMNALKIMFSAMIGLKMAEWFIGISAAVRRLTEAMIAFRVALTGIAMVSGGKGAAGMAPAILAPSLMASVPLAAGQLGYFQRSAQLAAAARAGQATGQLGLFENLPNMAVGQQMGLFGIAQSAAPVAKAAAPIAATSMADLGAVAGASGAGPLMKLAASHPVITVTVAAVGTFVALNYAFRDTVLTFRKDGATLGDYWETLWNSNLSFYKGVLGIMRGDWTAMIDYFEQYKGGLTDAMINSRQKQNNAIMLSGRKSPDQDYATKIITDANKKSQQEADDKKERQKQFNEALADTIEKLKRETRQENELTSAEKLGKDAVEQMKLAIEAENQVTEMANKAKKSHIGMSNAQKDALWGAVVAHGMAKLAAEREREAIKLLNDEVKKFNEDYINGLRERQKAEEEIGKKKIELSVEANGYQRLFDAIGQGADRFNELKAAMEVEKKLEQMGIDITRDDYKATREKLYQMDKQKKAIEEFQSSLQAAVSLFQQSLSPAEQYAQEVEHIWRAYELMHDKGLDLAHVETLLEQAADKFANSQEEVIRKSTKFADGWKRAFDQYAKYAKDAAKQVEQVIGGTMNSLEQFVTNFVKTGQGKFGDVLRDINGEIFGAIFRRIVTGPLAELLKSAGNKDDKRPWTERIKDAWKKGTQQNDAPIGSLQNPGYFYILGDKSGSRTTAGRKRGGLTPTSWDGADTVWGSIDSGFNIPLSGAKDDAKLIWSKLTGSVEDDWSSAAKGTQKDWETVATNTGAGFQNLLSSLFSMMQGGTRGILASAINVGLDILGKWAGNQVSGGGGGGDTSGGGGYEPTPGTIQAAMGGVWNGQGMSTLRRYARGGIAREPMVVAGEGTWPEAIVPLPDGRSIPVNMKGAMAPVINVHFHGVTDMASYKKSQQQIKADLYSTLAQAQKRHG